MEQSASRSSSPEGGSYPGRTWKSERPSAKETSEVSWCGGHVTVAAWGGGFCCFVCSLVGGGGEVKRSYPGRSCKSQVIDKGDF